MLRSSCALGLPGPPLHTHCTTPLECLCPTGFRAPVGHAGPCSPRRAAPRHNALGAQAGAQASVCHNHGRAGRRKDAVGGAAAREHGGLQPPCCLPKGYTATAAWTPRSRSGGESAGDGWANPAGAEGPPVRGDATRYTADPTATKSWRPSTRMRPSERQSRQVGVVDGGRHGTVPRHGSVRLRAGSLLRLCPRR